MEQGDRSDNRTHLPRHPDQYPQLEAAGGEAMSSYHEEQRRKMILRLRDLLLELPDFCFEYFRGIEPTTAERTRLGYPMI